MPELLPIETARSQLTFKRLIQMKRRQSKGSALAIGLVILTSITVISITSMQRSGIQGRMVGNIQQKELGFHAANGELEQIFQFYSSQPSATSALAAPLNSFDIVNGEQVFSPVAPGHESHYNQESSSGQSYSKPKLAVSSNIVHTGSANSLVEGFSIGTFVEFGFVVTGQSTTPIELGNPKQLSSQSLGIKYIAPAG